VKVIDTNVVSELMRPSPAPAVTRWREEHLATPLQTTSICVAELLLGVALLPAGRRKETLAQAVNAALVSFGDRVLDFDEAAAAEYATVRSDRQRGGEQIEALDAQIAAICRVHGATLVTRNTKDFRDTGVELINPWE